MKVVTNPAYPFLADFFCHLSDRFETEGTTIYEGRNVLKRFNIEGCELVVKSFKVRSLSIGLFMHYSGNQRPGVRMNMLSRY